MNAQDRTRLALRLLGWQGGTVHQICDEFGLSVQDFLYADAQDVGMASDFSFGWFARRTSNWPEAIKRNRGNLQFFFGAIAAENLNEIESRSDKRASDPARL